MSSFRFPFIVLYFIEYLQVNFYEIELCIFIKHSTQSPKVTIIVLTKVRGVNLLDAIQKVIWHKRLLVAADDASQIC